MADLRFRLSYWSFGLRSGIEFPKNNCWSSQKEQNLEHLFWVSLESSWDSVSPDSAKTLAPRANHCPFSAGHGLHQRTHQENILPALPIEWMAKKNTHFCLALTPFSRKVHIKFRKSGREIPFWCHLKTTHGHWSGPLAPHVSRIREPVLKFPNRNENARGFLGPRRGTWTPKNRRNH